MKLAKSSRVGSSLIGNRASQHSNQDQEKTHTKPPRMGKGYMLHQFIQSEAKEGTDSSWKPGD